MNKEERNIELKSEEVQEILGKVPSWVTRWGTTVIFLAVIGILVVAALVKYPEVIDTPVVLTSNQPPVTVVSKTAGNLESFFVEEGDTVQQGELLAVMQNTMNEEDLATISDLMDTFLDNPTKQLNLNFPASPSLGSLQESYANFVTNYKDYILYAKQNVNASSIEYIRQQILQFQYMNNGLNGQLNDCNSELTVFFNNYQTDQDLYLKGVISQRQLQESETAYLQKKTVCEGIAVQIQNNYIRINELEMQIFGLSSGDRQSDLQKFTLLRESANKLKSDIQLWKEQFQIIAPIDGVVSLNDIWTSSQYVQNGVELLSIIRNNESIKARADLGSDKIGKVIVGQTVNIRFTSYNHMQFGLVKGTVTSVSAVPRNDAFQIDIALDNGLKTTYNKNIRFQQGMVGTAKIVTEKRTILARIFDKFKFLFSEKY